MNTGKLARVRGPARRWILAAAVLLAAAALVFVFTDSPAPTTTSLDRTLQDLEDQVRSNPQDLDGRLAVAAAYAQRGRYADAILQYEESLVIAADNQTALIGLGRVYLEQGRTDAAFSALERVAELSADNPMRYTVEALEAVYYDLARIHLERGEPAEARVRLEEALKINSTDADALRLLGSVEAQQGNPEAAEDALLRAVRLVPDFIEAYQDLEVVYQSQSDRGGVLFAQGMVHLIEGRVAASVQSLEQAVIDRPEFADAHQGLGMAYETSEAFPSALQAYERARDLDPTLFLSASAIDRLQVRVGGAAPSGGD